MSRVLFYVFMGEMFFIESLQELGSGWAWYRIDLEAKRAVFRTIFLIMIISDVWNCIGHAKSFTTRFREYVGDENSCRNGR